LLFVSPNCPSCTATLYEIEALSSKAKGDVMIICRGAQGECQELTGNHDLHIPIIVDEDELVTRLYGVSSHPTAVIISDRDRIQSYGHPLRATDLEGAIEDANDDVRQEVG
jgi:peroxiredoxin